MPDGLRDWLAAPPNDFFVVTPVEFTGTWASATIDGEQVAVVFQEYWRRRSQRL